MLLRRTALCLSAPLFSMPVLAANVAGTIYDRDSHRPLPGVLVADENGVHGEVTDANGRFVYAVGSAAEAHLRISSLGYRDTVVTLKSGEQGSVGLVLDGVDLGTSSSRDQLQGQARSLNRQKNSDNIRNVVSADQIGRFPDQNAAEAIQRVPGVSVARDQGEGRFVLIRGTEPRLSSVKLDGIELPAPEGDIRSVALDVVPSGLLGSVEVSKTLTPEMDADAIGGQVDLKTRRATSERPEVSLSLAGGYNQELETFREFEGSFGYGQRFLKDGKLGVFVGGGYGYRKFGSDNIEMEYGSLDVLDSAAVNEDGDPEETGDEVDAYESIELRDYEIVRDRISVNSTVDWRFGAASDIYLEAAFNRFGDDEHRRSLSIDYGSGELYNNDLSTIEGAEVGRNLKDRYEYQDLGMVALGGEHIFGKVRTDFRTAWSFASETEPDRQDISYQAKSDVKPSTKHSDFPSLGVSEDVYDPSEFELEKITRMDNKTTEHNLIAMANAEFPLSESMDWTLKLGGKYRHKSKERDNQVSAWKWDAESDPPTLDEISSTLKDDDFLNGKYPQVGASPDPSKHRDVYDKYKDSLKGGSDLEDDNLADYEATEDLAAGYLQTRIELGRWMILTGARLENTWVDYTGRAVDLDEETIHKVSDDNSDLHVLPALHVRYALTPSVNLRLAGFSSLSRPDFYDLVPYYLVEEDEVSMGNPDLKTSTAQNFDAMAEYYFHSVGVFSVGYYYKWIEDLIYNSTYDLDGLEIEQKRNGEWAQIHGMEAAWNQQFTFLPGFLAGLGVYTNYSYSWSEAKIPGRSDRIDMPGQSAHMANAAISFERWGFSTKLAWNFHGSYVSEVGSESDEDVYYDNHSQLDWSLSQRIAKGLTVFAEVNNLTDEPLRYYQGSDDNPVQEEYYGISCLAGIRYAF